MRTNECIHPHEYTIEMATKRMFDTLEKIQSYFEEFLISEEAQTKLNFSKGDVP